MRNSFYRKALLTLLAAGVFTTGVITRVSGGAADHPGPIDSEFTFVRLIYSTHASGYGYRGNDSWRVDWPDAEYHFLQGLKRLTRVNAAADGHLLTLMDEELYDYPWLYVLEVGYWVLSDAEVDRLREYLLRGGFLMIDDFHGTREWAAFMNSMRKVFPDRRVTEIADDEEVMHVFYDLEKQQIPGIQTYWSGVTYEKDGFTPHWRGIYDDNGRLMVAINFNMDIGDAWEHADHPYYPEPMTALAYRFGVNYVIYSMTH